VTGGLREAMRDPRVAGALAGVAILLGGYRFYAAVRERPAQQPPAAVREAAAPAEGKISSPAGTPEAAPRETAGAPKAVQWSWERNPFLRPDLIRSAGGPGDGTAKREPEGGLLADLRGTVITGNHGIAIFGDRLVPAGGKVGEWTVENVAPYGVSLRRGGETRTVEMFKPSP